MVVESLVEEEDEATSPRTKSKVSVGGVTLFGFLVLRVLDGDVILGTIVVRVSYCGKLSRVHLPLDGLM